MARLTVLAVEQRPELRVFNAVTEAIPLNSAARLVAQATQAADGAQSVSRAEASGAWGSFWSEILARNLWLSSTLAGHVLGWKPSAPSFGEDLLHGSYQAKQH